MAKVGVDPGGWRTKTIRGTHGCGLWKGILSGWAVFSQHFELVAGLGNYIRFWQDKWCGDFSLRERFHILYTCCSHRDATIESLLVISNPEGL